jgi:hypothetical protein
MDLPNIAQLHGRSLEDAIDLLYRRAIDRLIPQLARYIELRRQGLQTRADQIIAEAQHRETSGVPEVQHHLENQGKAPAAPLSKPANLDYAAEAKCLLEARHWIRFSPSASQRLWSPGRQADIHKLREHALLEAARPLIEALCKSELSAVGIVEHRFDEARVPPEFFRAGLWVLYRERSRLVELGERNRELWPGCCDLRLVPPIRTKLTRVQTVAAAMNALNLPIDSVEKTSFDLVRRQLKAWGDTACANAGDVALKKLMQRANEKRQKDQQD